MMMPFPLGLSERVGYCFQPKKKKSLLWLFCQTHRSSVIAVLYGGLWPVQEPVGEFQDHGGWDGGRDSRTEVVRFIPLK